MRTISRSWVSVLVLSAVTTMAACSDQPTSPRAVTPEDIRGPSASSEVGTLTGKTVIVFNDTASIPAAGLSLISVLGGTVTAQWDDIGVAFATGLTASALQQLSASTLVSSVGQDRIVNWLPPLRIGGTVEDPDALSHKDPAASTYYKDGRQYGPRIIKANVAWAAGIQGTSSTRVAIIDTGIDYTHRELVGLVDLSASAAFSSVAVCEADVCVDSGVDPQYPGDEPYMDNHFHGTHVASTVASNSISVAGVAPHVTLIAVKALSAVGSGSFEGVASAIRHAAGSANADVINMSLGAGIDATLEGATALLDLMARTIKQAEKQGAIVISAAGNDALNLDVGNIVYTPCEQSTICVSATGPLNQQDFDQPATYTNYGITAIEVAAPGGNAHDDDSKYQTEDLIIGACSSRSSSATLNACRINAAGGPHLYAWAAGTSMATPHVAGAAALIKSFDPSISVNGLRNKLMHSADDVGTKGRDVYSNWGRINVAKALGLE